MPGGILQLVREALAEPSSSWSNINEDDIDLAVRVLSSSRVAPYNDATLEDLKAEHPLKSAHSLPHIPIDHQLIASLVLVLDMIKSFPHDTSCRRDGLRARHLIDC
ncbi:hypothetical protein Tco_1287565 [Tanacetum coccineum]